MATCVARGGIRFLICTAGLRIRAELSRSRIRPLREKKQDPDPTQMKKPEERSENRIRMSDPKKPDSNPAQEKKNEFGSDPTITTRI